MGILQNQTSGLLQLILYKRHGKVVGDTLFFERLTQGVTEEAHALGYDLSVRYFYGSQSTDEQICAIQSEPFEALLRFGYRIPQDVSVIGFDDSGISTTRTPPLTTMQVQKQRLGALGGRPFAHSPAKKCGRDPARKRSCPRCSCVKASSTAAIHLTDLRVGSATGLISKKAPAFIHGS